MADIEARVAAIRWHHAFEVVSGVMTPGAYQPAEVFARLGLPDDMTGQRVLDIGTRDGFYAFGCEERGAEVIAVDYMPAAATGFALAHELRGSRVVYLHRNLYALDPHELGVFEVVIFLGVIYHVPDPYLALRIVRGLTKTGGQAFVESTCIEGEVTTAAGTFDVSVLRELPFMAFAAVDPDNFWDPNSACLRVLVERASFAIERHEHWGNRQLIAARAIDDPRADWIDRTARGLR